jgi:hypothetical protein
VSNHAALGGGCAGGAAIHPNGTGHAIMAETVLKEWPEIQAKMKAYKAKFKATTEAKATADAKAEGKAKAK